jgi:hypothetical protein
VALLVSLAAGAEGREEKLGFLLCVRTFLPEQAGV